LPVSTTGASPAPVEIDFSLHNRRRILTPPFSQSHLDFNEIAMSERTVSVVQVFAFVWRYWRRFPVQFAIIFAGVLGAVALEVQIPAFTANLVRAVEQFFAGTQEADIAWRAMWSLLLLFVSVSLVQQFYFRVWVHFAANVMQRLVADGFFRVQRFSADWHANNFAGATVRKISRGMWSYDTFADTVVIHLGPALIILLGFSIAMFLREPVLGAYFTGGVLLFLCASITVSLKYVAPANRAANDADTALGGALADAITCNPVIKAFGAEQREDAQLYGVAGQWRMRARRAWRRSLDAGALQSLLIIVLLGGLLAIVLRLAAQGTAQLEDVVYVLTAYFVVNGYLRNVGMQVRNLQRAINELDDLVAIHQLPPQVADTPGARPFCPTAGHIRFEHVHFGYQNQPRAVFEGLTLEIGPKEKVALVGESGAGKTTFVKLLQRLYDVQRGRIVIDGQTIAEVTQESLRANIALVPQEPVLFHRTLLENLTYARPDATFDEVVDAARRAHAHAFIERLADGYHSLVGERGIKLSGGERQRIAIARAILSRSPILVLDEATSSLDSLTEHYIQDAIANVMAERTAILIAHRLSTVRQCDRILVFEAGRIVEQGTHDALLADSTGVYRRLYDMQSLGYIDVDGIAQS
jgi:ATP-binding cassette, subfamily B, bacterial